MKKVFRKKELAWAFYDWANSAFATTIMAGFFPVFFKKYWCAGMDASLSTMKLGTVNSLAGLAVAVMAPFLGALADRGGARKKYLVIFATLGVAATALLPALPSGLWLGAALAYGMASIGFSASNIFYDSLLPSVTVKERYDRVSALGFSLGYLGGGLLFAINVWMVSSPDTFGLADSAAGVKVSFTTVAVWWALFTLPLLLLVEEPSAASGGAGSKLAETLGELKTTLANIRGYRNVWVFLVAYWLYIDGVDTVIRMAVDYGLSLGFETSALMTALLVTQFVGFPAAIAFGRLGERLGPKKAIYLGIAAYMLIVCWGYFMDSEAEFFGLAVGVGLVQGGVQALSRSLYSRMVPREKEAEFFGFYNMLGKFAVVIGPALMGWTVGLTGNPRAGILAVAILFIAGAALLTRVDVDAGMREAGRA